MKLQPGEQAGCVRLLQSDRNAVFSEQDAELTIAVSKLEVREFIRIELEENRS